MRRFTVLLALLLLAAMVVAVAPADAGVSCHNINARGFGQTSDLDPDNGYVVRTAAQIRGGGLLQGTTDAQFVEGEGLEGKLTFTTNRGELTVWLEGVINLDGTFSAETVEKTVDEVDYPFGEGKLAKVESVDLLFEGEIDFSAPNHPFTETVTGELCVDLGGNGKK